MKKTMISSAIATVLVATGLIANSAWASDREIYQRGGEGSVAVMLTLDLSRTMSSSFGTLDDGFSDYYGCTQSTKDKQLKIGKDTIEVKYCYYTDNILNFNGFFLRKKFPSYQDYVKETCDVIEHDTIFGRENNRYHCYSRLVRTQMALIGLLYGDTDRGIAKLTDDKVIGLSVFPAFSLTGDKQSQSSVTGAVVVPARRLDAKVGTEKQRDILAKAILGNPTGKKSLWDKIIQNDNVPIASALAETAAYMMGTSTNAGFREWQRADIKWDNAKDKYSYKFKQLTNYLKYCNLIGRDKNDPKNWDEFGQCTLPANWLDFEREEIITDYSDMYTLNQRNEIDLKLDSATFVIDDATKRLKTSGYIYSDASIVNQDKTYKRPEIIDAQVKDPSLQQCHAQGIYLITGGLSHVGDRSQGDGTIDFYIKRMMNRSLNASTYKNNFCQNGSLSDYTNVFGNENNYIDNSSWSCISEYAERLKSGNNPTGLEIKTAVVGIGKQFGELPSSNLSQTTAQNVNELEKAIKELEEYKDGSTLLYKKRTLHNIKNTALLGLYGGGGWYSAMSPQDIAESFNSFVNVISKDIPSASVNKAVIPVDILNPYELQPHAYLTMYEPSVQGAVSAWAGNLKRYNIGKKGWVVDSSGNNAFAANGLIKDSVKDLWENSTLTDSEKLKARIFQGGALNQLPLGKNENNNFKRTIYTTRDCKEQANKTEPKCDSSADLKLKKVNTNYFDKNAISSKDPLRGYLLALLGYDVPNPANINDADILNVWQSQPELRQMGAILHSDPILLTQQGQVVRDGESIVTKDRHDYVLFGTTQGLLHVLDAKTGKEKFAFVPNEMVEKNHKAFVNPDAASASGQFLYGIDGPWTVHTEYVAANKDDQTLTVGKGAGEGIVGKQWVYGGLRMGGRSYYALDLTDLDSPKVKFHIDPYEGIVFKANGDKKAYPQLKSMGQSWSKPVITRVNWQGTDKLVMIVGGGYDNSGQNQGYEYPLYKQVTEVRRGAGVYMFDADNGDLLWWASRNANRIAQSAHDGITPDKNGTIGHYIEDMGYSVVSTIKTVDRDGDKLTDHLYFGDLGGQVWRVDFNNFRNAEQPFATHIVRLLNETSSEAGKQPRFYVQPTFSIYRTPGSGRVMAAINIGSGNASSPLHDSNNEANWKPNAVYTLFDKDVTRSNLYSLTTSQLKQDLVPQALTATQRNGVATNTIDASQDGWKYVFSENSFYLDSNQTTGQKFYSTPMGAKVITDPVLMNNQLFVSVFDGAKSGTVQGCDAGIKGESVIERFCMPFGACGSNSGIHNSLYAGVGIAPINLSSAGQGAANSRTIINSQCEGDHCAVGNIGSDVHSDNQLNRKLRPMRWFERE